MERIIELDLITDILLGFEKHYDSINAEVLRLARKQGHILPPIDVIKEGDIYQIVFGRSMEEDWINYGGHTRSIVAHQEKLLLPCKILPAHRKDPSTYEDPYNPSDKIEFFPIQEMKPKRKTDADSMNRLERNLKFLPAKLRKKLIKEHDLIELKDGKIMDRDNYENPPPF